MRSRVLRRCTAVGLLLAGLLLVPAGAAMAQGVALDTAGPGTAAGLWAARLLNHLALASAVGLALVPAWLLARGPIGATGRRAAGLAAAAALVWALSAGAILVFGLSNAAARPLPEALDGALLVRFLGTRFGTAVAAQAGVALLAAVLLVTARNRPGARLGLAVLAVGALGPPLWGHAGTADLRAVAIASDWLHIVAGAAWAGGLVAVTALLLGRGYRPDPAGPVARYSALAGLGFAAVAATGVVNVLLHTTAPSQLVETSWGRLAVVKALLVVALGAMGWRHRRRTIPKLSSTDPSAARGAFRRLAAIELVLMLAAFGLATTMASGLPANVEAAARIQVFTAPLGEGLAEVSLDPARTGRNELHLYLYDAGRALQPVDGAEVVLRAGEVEVTPRLTPAGPGHFTGFSVNLPASGAYRVTVRAEIDGETVEAVGTVTVR